LIFPQRVDFSRYPRSADESGYRTFGFGLDEAESSKSLEQAFID
jgi:hypothetical protein